MRKLRTSGSVEGLALQNANLLYLPLFLPGLGVKSGNGLFLAFIRRFENGGAFCFHSNHYVIFSE